MPDRRRLLATALAVTLVAPLALGARTAAGGSAHDFDFVSIEGEPLPLAGFRGQPILLVNTASFCGFTPQYEGLQALWERYRDRGLVVLGVPSDNFGGQEYGSNEEIREFCDTQFGIDFPLTEKQDVRGSAAHPLYRWLAEAHGEAAVPRWNFHKVLIDGEGQPLQAWPTAIRPDAPELVMAVERALADRG